MEIYKKMYKINVPLLPVTLMIIAPAPLHHLQ